MHEEEQQPGIAQVLAHRYPGLSVTAARHRVSNGNLVQTVCFRGPVPLLERHKLTDRAFILRRRDGTTRPVLDAGGARIYGFMVEPEDGEETAVFGIQTTVEQVAEEKALSKWAAVGASRILRRLRKTTAR